MQDPRYMEITILNYDDLVYICHQYDQNIERMKGYMIEWKLFIKIVLSTFK